MITIPRRSAVRALLLSLALGSAAVTPIQAAAQTVVAVPGPLTTRARDALGEYRRAAAACDRAAMARLSAELNQLMADANAAQQAVQAAGQFAEQGAADRARREVAGVRDAIVEAGRVRVCAPQQQVPAPTPTPTTPPATPGPTPPPTPAPPSTPVIGGIPITPPSTAPDPWLRRLTDIRIQRNAAVRTCNRAALEEAIRAFEEFKRTSVAQAINPTAANNRARLIDNDIAQARQALTQCPATPPGQAQPTPPPAGQGVPQANPAQSTPRPAVDPDYYDSLEGRFNRLDARVSGMRITGGCVRPDEIEDFEKLVEDLRAQLRTVEGVAATGLPTNPTVAQARQRLTEAEELLRQARVWSQQQQQCPPSDLFDDEEEDDDDDRPWWSFGLYVDGGYQHLVEEDTNIGMATGRAGFQFHPNIAVEGEVSVGIFGEENETSSGGSIFRSSLDIDFDLAAYVVASLPLSDETRVMARVGYGVTEFSSSFTSGSTTTDGSGSTDTLRYGLGFEFLFDPDTAVRVTWTRWDDVFSDSGGVDADVFGISLVQRLSGRR